MTEGKKPQCSGEIYEATFQSANQTLLINSEEVALKDLAKSLTKKNRVLLDTTTLGLGEILKVLSAVKLSGKDRVELLYAEPLEYTSGSQSNVANRDYRLTDNCRFVGVQGFAQEYDSNQKANHVFMLGFEPGRLENALEQRGDTDPEKYRYQFVIGVPAFNCGWESNSLFPHLPAFEELDATQANFSYCQANSIREAYIKLWELFAQVGDESSMFFVSPLGTKPHTVATALFLLETRGSVYPTSLYYDHPVRVLSRSRNVGAWHHVIVDGVQSNNMGG